MDLRAPSSTQRITLTAPDLAYPELVVERGGERRLDAADHVGFADLTAHSLDQHGIENESARLANPRGRAALGGLPDMLSGWSPSFRVFTHVRLRVNGSHSAVARDHPRRALLSAGVKGPEAGSSNAVGYETRKAKPWKAGSDGGSGIVRRTRKLPGTRPRSPSTLTVGRVWPQARASARRRRTCSFAQALDGETAQVH